MQVFPIFKASIWKLDQYFIPGWLGQWLILLQFQLHQAQNIADCKDSIYFFIISYVLTQTNILLEMRKKMDKVNIHTQYT